jgi:hypothetical protein
MSAAPRGSREDVNGQQGNDRSDLRRAVDSHLITPVIVRWDEARALGIDTGFDDPHCEGIAARDLARHREANT